MQRTWTIVGVRDVPGSFKWYQALKRARALVSSLAEEPHVNPNTRTPEFSLRDPDGYFVTIRRLDAGGLRSGRVIAAHGRV
jgi:hypothetical protein